MIKRRNIKWIVPFFLVGLFAINLPTILHAQATFNKPAANQKFSYYFSKAKKNNKKGSKAYAANNAIQALAVAEKKNQIKKSQKLLAETMPLAIQWIEQLVATNEKRDKTFKGDQTISNQLHLISGLKEMTYAKAQYSQLPSDRLKMKKGPALNFTIEDYQARIKKEESLLPELFEKGAAMHYTAAMKLEGNRHWSNQINIAKKLAKVVHYVPDYKDAKERYAKAKKEGVCRMTLGRVQNISQRGHLTEEAIRNGMIYDLTKRGADDFSILF